MCDYNGEMCRCGTRMEWKDDVSINGVIYFYWDCETCGKSITIGTLKSEIKAKS